MFLAPISRSLGCVLAKKPSLATLGLACSLLLLTALSPCSGEETAPSAYTSLLKKTATVAEAEQQAQKLMKAMTPEERFEFVYGAGLAFKPLPRLGIPEIRLCDASSGYRIQKADIGQRKSTAFPCPLLIAATWDMDAVSAYAQAIAEEFRAYGIHFILGPGMNMYRNPKCGRNFEYVGEDPFLAANVIKTYVTAAQGENVATTLKHFIGNETDFRRRASNSIIGERALHEIYLPPFKAGIDAGAWAVMTSYNLVNGEWAAENHTMVTDILKGTLGFKFMVMSDWMATWHGEKLIKSGLDMEMPKGYSLKYDRAKVLGAPEIDRMVVNVLKTCIFSGLYEMELNGSYKKPEWLEKFPQHANVARKVNAEGIVLLKNNGVLPLPSTPSGTILVTGSSATREELSGGGSSHVQGYNLKTYLKAVQEQFGDGNVVYASDPSDEQIRSAKWVLVFTGFNLPVEGKPRTETCESEGCDRATVLPEDALVARCTKLNPKTVVNLVCGSGVQMDWADQAAAIVLASYGGQTGADALVDILTGKVNPSGKLPFTIEKRFEDSCAAKYGAGKPTPSHADPVDLATRLGKNIAEFYKSSDGKEAYTYDINYDEGVFIGYRWYDKMSIEPRYPFGFGLSYTTFDYSGLKLSSNEFKPGTLLKIQITIKNTGQREGAEVAQLYVSELKPTVPRPPRELKGFTRVNLKPGESKTVVFELGKEAFSFYDDKAHAWKINPGAFEIQAGASSRDLRLKAPVTIKL